VLLAGTAAAGTLLVLAAGVSGCTNDSLAQTADCAGATALEPGESPIYQIATTHGLMSKPPTGFASPATSTFAHDPASEPLSWCVTSDPRGLNARCAVAEGGNVWQRAYLIDREGRWVRVPPDLTSGKAVTPCP
jgi:hypothetical protein